MKRSKERNSVENSNTFLIDFLNFFAKRRKLVVKMTHQKKIRGSEHPRSLNPCKVISMAICPIIVHFTTSTHTQCVMWRVNFIWSKDAQKQLA